MMTLSQRLKDARERLALLDDRRRAAITLGALGSLTAYELEESRRLEGEICALEREERAAVEAERTAARRAELTKVVVPTSNLLRPAVIRRLGEHIVDLALEHNLEVFTDGRCPRSNAHTRRVYVPPCLTEESYSIALHEIAHVVLPAADAQQRRHVFLKSSVASPEAEIAAWRWAISTARFWSRSMQTDMVDAIETYRSLANGDERTAMNVVIGFGELRVRPAPDTHEGREWRLQSIQREDRVRAIEATSSRRRCQQILRERGLA